MSDRRQGDRREGGSKKITVSLSTFVFTIIIAVIVVAAVIVCVISTKKAYNNGYSQALIDTSGTSTYSSDGIEEFTDSGFSSTVTSDLNVNAMAVTGGESNIAVSSSEQ